MQPLCTIEDWLAYATHEFTKANIASARLDAELILCHMLGVDRTWLITHAGDSLTLSALSQKGGDRRSGIKEYGEKIILRRLKREPIAYLIGKKEFYRRPFIVTPDVLIPRPETETLIDIAKELHLPDSPVIHDVGTGSGCIAITLALELPRARVSASDISDEALAVARKNAKALAASVTWSQDDLMNRFHETVDVITANLPYVDRSWEVSPEVKSEPALALFADDGGLELIKQLLPQAADHLHSRGYLLLEADPEQHPAIVAHAKNHGLQYTESRDYIVVLQKN